MKATTTKTWSVLTATVQFGSYGPHLYRGLTVGLSPRGNRRFCGDPRGAVLPGGDQFEVQAGTLCQEGRQFVLQPEAQADPQM